MHSHNTHTPEQTAQGQKRKAINETLGSESSKRQKTNSAHTRPVAFIVKEIPAPNIELNTDQAKLFALIQKQEAEIQIRAMKIEQSKRMIFSGNQKIKELTVIQLAMGKRLRKQQTTTAQIQQTFQQNPVRAIVVESSITTSSVVANNEKRTSTDFVYEKQEVNHVRPRHF